MTAGCPTQAKPGSAVYADYFAKQLDREDERKVSLEASGVLVVTTSGVLSTILLGLATLTKKKDAAFALPGSARWWVVAALVLLTLAVAGAIVTNFPFESDEADVDGLRKLVAESWADSPSEAERTVAINRLSVLSSAKHERHSGLAPLWCDGLRASCARCDCGSGRYLPLELVSE